MARKVYTIGYSRRSIEELSQIADTLDAVIFDVRHSPWSRRPEFRKKHLAKVLGRQYQHVPDLGNVNYRSGGSIKIANLDSGQALIEASERPVILMCACFDSRICHRTTIANHLRSEGFSVEELTDVEE